MARTPTSGSGTQSPALTNIDELLLQAMERGDESLETGRYIVTYNADAANESKALLESLDLRMADARDYDDQAATMAALGEGDGLVLPEIGVAIVSSPDFVERGMAMAEDSSTPIEIVEPEHFMFAEELSADYLRGFRRAVEALTADAGGTIGGDSGEIEAESLGATWGLNACRVPPSSRSGLGIRVAVLDTGMALNHPDFAGRQFVTNTFVGQPVQDLNGHGTHCIGTSCGPLSPPGTTPRYGIGHKVAPIFVGKVLSNAGSGSTGTVLAGMNWAIANGCQVISMSLGAPIPVQAAYTAAGLAALARGCLIVAAAGNESGPTGAPANSPSIMSVASLDPNLSPSNFSNFGKVEISGPGRDIFSSWPLPLRYRTISGTSMATPHVAGCAALWAQTSPALRGQALWNKLLATAKPLPFPPSRVGKGLVQAPS
jgi:hypothetical protein